MTSSTKRRFALSAVALSGVLLAAACSSTTATGGNAGPNGNAGTSTGGPTSAPASGYPLDSTLKLNMIQAIGTHNSYHVRTPQVFRDAIEKVVPGATSQWDYEQPTLDKQFDEGVRQIELDVHLDPDGRYAQRHGNPLAGLPIDAPTEMKQPGLKVFHIQELDYNTNCTVFIACLTTVKTWSDAHPGHVPIMILIEAKDDDLPKSITFPSLGIDFPVAQSIKFDKSGLDQIDTEIRKVFDDKSMILPDQVRGTHKTLEEAVLAGGWPTLGESRGKVLFTLDNGGLRAQYADGHPSLQGRVMFTDAEPGEPEAAFVERNDAKEKTPGEINDLVKKGYVVRTRSDAETEAPVNDLSTMQAALATAAQWISTDFPVPDPKVNPTYEVKLTGGTPAICNPVTAPANCKPADIENPAYLTTK